ncbi:chitinase 5-like [Hibiscus syriacus]|uniref:Chitinase 5-like n=1 Tax=Hibiscus syriacus TaxID=106335 RepID=A0A6A3C6C5_HIBSY|nr:endochitinase EP3-like [Hibiscus syriacus]KAE8722589.1 chitinase 5-like [Hibiscus syriacus]
MRKHFQPFFWQQLLPPEQRHRTLETAVANKLNVVVGGGNDFRSTRYQKGPCNPLPISVVDIVTPQFFNAIMNVVEAGCEGKNFYSRSAFLEALSPYPGFGRIGSIDDYQREIEAFFSLVTQETGLKIPHFFPINVYFGDRLLHAFIYQINYSTSIIGLGQVELKYYIGYCNQLGVDPEPNLTC